ncbi:MAG TPA: hypothetical protein VHB68_14795 [Steroidobacteraceae bacterium]|nr:hypothetical protein [Steroidobacteraceae bacterium]
MTRYEESLIARSLAGNTGRLPDGAWPSIGNGVPVGPSGGDRPYVLPKRQVRSLTDTWWHNGKVVEPGQLVTLPQDEAAGLVARKLAEYVK